MSTEAIHEELPALRQRAGDLPIFFLGVMREHMV